MSRESNSGRLPGLNSPLHQRWEPGLVTAPCRARDRRGGQARAITEPAERTQPRAPRAAGAAALRKEEFEFCHAGSHPPAAKPAAACRASTTRSHVVEALNRRLIMPTE